MGAVKDFLDKCVNTKVDIEALERLMEPENGEVSLRFILKYSTRRGSNIFLLFDTTEKKDHFVASRTRWLESQGKDATKQESWQHEWHDIRYQGVSHGKSSSVPREDPENADAAAKLAFIQGGRKASGSLWKTGEGGVSLSKRWQGA